MSSSIPQLLLTPHKPFISKFPSSKPTTKTHHLTSQIIKKQSLYSPVLACSTSYPFIGKVGLHRREGNFNLLSYGTNPNMGSSAFAVKGDVSQILSAMLPFVVAVTAVAALTQPLTFTW